MKQTTKRDRQGQYVTISTVGEKAEAFIPSPMPPPPERVLNCIRKLELLLHDRPHLTPVPLKAALAHVQFETIHAGGSKMMVSQKVDFRMAKQKASDSRHANFVSQGVLTVRHSDIEMKQNAEVGLFAKPSKMKWVSRLSISALMFLFLCLSGCTAIKATVHLLRSTDHLVPLEADGRVLYEPGAEEFARRMAELLPDAVRQVEAGHYRPFAKEVRIRVCVSEESFHDLTGMDVKALLTLKGVFFSPRVLKELENLPSYLAHELSHLHLEQQIGRLKYAKLPAWFKEGLATLVSEGGGANKVTESEAVEAI